MNEKLSRIKAKLFMIVLELERLEANPANAPPRLSQKKKAARLRLKLIKGGKD